MAGGHPASGEWACSGPGAEVTMTKGHLRALLTFFLETSVWRYDYYWLKVDTQKYPLKSRTQLASEGPLLSLPCLSFFICKMGITLYYAWEGYFLVWASHGPCLGQSEHSKVSPGPCLGWANEPLRTLLTVARGPEVLLTRAVTSPDLPDP